VRSDDEVNAMLAVSSIKGGINASREKRQAAAAAPISATNAAVGEVQDRHPAGVA
jgi:hypothetical protein